MSELDQTLARLHTHPGVEQVLLLGDDGLLVRRFGEAADTDVEAVAALGPSLATAAHSLGEAAGRGALRTAVLEYAQGVAIVTPLDAELILAVLLRPGVGFAPLLRALRSERPRLAELLQ